jgi:DNA-binding transcriptional ArsR family regulator
LPLAWEPKIESQSGPPPGSKARGGRGGAARTDEGIGSAEFTDHERLVAFYTMSCRDDEELKILLVSMSDGTRRRMMQLLARLPGGVDLCAAVLEAMPSSLATRHLVELIDYPANMLPTELHEQVAKAMHADAIAEAEQARSTASLPQNKLTTTKLHYLTCK